MKDFESLKDMWLQKDVTPAMAGKPVVFSKTSATSKLKLQRQQLLGARMLILTSVLIACLAIFGNLNFNHWYTYGAMVLICAVCIAQSILLYFTYKKIKLIDETAKPAQHLQQWEAYYVFRKKQVSWNMPLYFIALNVAMGLYLVEVLSGRRLVNVAIGLSVYIIWMLFAYFYLGKRNLKKEQSRLESIINELKSIEEQLD